MEKFAFLTILRSLESLGQAEDLEHRNSADFLNCLKLSAK